MSNEKTARKAAKLIAEGDRHAAKGKLAKALKSYQKAHELDPAHEGLSAKLIEAHEKSLGDKDWDMKEFAEHMGMVLQLEAEAHPALKQVHAKLTPEWHEVSELVGRILMTEDEATAGALVEELVAKGEIATRALIEFLRTMKKESEHV